MVITKISQTCNLILTKQYQDRIKSLEESIEAERAAHLETKFNSEIVQVSQKRRLKVTIVKLVTLVCITLDDNF